MPNITRFWFTVFVIFLTATKRRAASCPVVPELDQFTETISLVSEATHPGFHTLFSSINGLTYHEDDGTLFLVHYDKSDNEANPILLELSLTGKLLYTAELDGFYSPTGVTWIGAQKLAIIEELTSVIKIIDLSLTQRSTFNSPSEPNAVEIDETIAFGSAAASEHFSLSFSPAVPSVGFEGIAYHTTRGTLLLVQEKVQKRLYEYDSVNHDLENLKTIGDLEPVVGGNGGTLSVDDLAGMDFDPSTSTIFILSEESATVFRVGTVGVLSSLHILDQLDVSSIIPHPEGIALIHTSTDVALVLAGQGTLKLLYAPDCSAAIENSTPIENTCSNGVQDGDETGIDCGGISCGVCYDGASCSSDVDCAGDGTCIDGTCANSGTANPTSAPTSPAQPITEPPTDEEFDSTPFPSFSPSRTPTAGTGAPTHNPTRNPTQSPTEDPQLVAWQNFWDATAGSNWFSCYLRRNDPCGCNSRSTRKVECDENGRITSIILQSNRLSSSEFPEAEVAALLALDTVTSVDISSNSLLGVSPTCVDIPLCATKSCLFGNTIACQDTTEPTVSPSISPTTHPTSSPTTSPTVRLTSNPTTSPSMDPTVTPTTTPTSSPTLSPNASPSMSPITAPTTSPTIKPTEDPQLVAWQNFWDATAGSNWISCYLRRNDPCGCNSRSTRKVECDENGRITSIILQSNRLSSSEFPEVEVAALLALDTVTIVDISSNSLLGVSPTCVDITECETKTCEFGDTTACQDTSEPTVSPISSPSSNPSLSPTIAPSTSPTLSPTASPSRSPSTSPTAAPTTISPTSSPISQPTNSPSMYPTANPTTSPTTASPTASPTAAPTTSPTMKPTEDPQLVAWQNFWDATAGSNWISCYIRRNNPCACNSRSTRKVECDENGRITSIILQSNRLSSSEFPEVEVAALMALDTVTSVDISSNSLLGVSPTCVDITECDTKTCEFGDTIACQDTSEPTTSPISSPSSNPSASPTLTPSTSPTQSPTASPSRSPSTSPTAAPTTISPTGSPTSQPTSSPSMYPTANPTTSPTTASPTASPTAAPTTSPTMKPTEDPQLVAWQNFWDATAGSNWISCYLRRNDPCGCNSRSTRKVECDENGRITSIILQSNRLSSSEFPEVEVAALMALDTVTNVDISSNSLLGVSPTCVDITECDTKTCEFGDTIACQDTSEPTMSPISSPSSNPSQSPTISPSTSPTLSPTASPSRSPSTSPTAAPTYSPSLTESPSMSPSFAPTMKPTEDPQLVAWQNFWDSTEGSNWIGCFLRRDDPCGCNSRSTRKVECDENGRITSIILQSNRLSSSAFPESEVAALLALDTVTNVDISSNSQLGESLTCVHIPECSTKSCVFGSTVACQNTLEPTTTPSASPTASPTMSPSNHPSEAPSTSPTSDAPTTPPTAAPTTSPTMKPTEDPQLVAWQNFWDTTAGSNWISCYLRRNDPCGCNSRSTRKVECDENGRITSIILQSNRLSSSEFPEVEVAALMALDTVTSVDISSNSLLGVSPTCVDITECETKTCEFGDTIACQDTSEPTVSPISSPSSNPSLSPTISPSTSPTLSPSASPSRGPSTSPTSAPTTISPTSSPTSQPTGSPSIYPTANPTTSPTTGSPTMSPTAAPTTSPTMKPTEDPQLVAWQNFWDATAGSNWIGCFLRRDDPCGCNSRSTRKVECDENGRITSIILQSNRLSSSEFPEAEVAALLALDTVTSVDISSNSLLGVSPTCVDITECETKTCEFGDTIACQDTSEPTMSPISSPSSNPSLSPTIAPSTSPTLSPTASPSREPSTSPTSAPTTISPTSSPTSQPTNSPSMYPTANPTTSPTTGSPTTPPTAVPTSSPTMKPTEDPQLVAWQNFWDATAGSNWISCYLRRNDPCGCNSRSTRKVECDENGRITSIVLQSNRLSSSEFPEAEVAALMALDTVTSVDISSNSLLGVSPTCVDITECDTKTCEFGDTTACQDTSEPTTSPISSPSSNPSASPTLTPSTSPTLSPTANPSRSPSTSPTATPTTTSPTSSPTSQPTSSPSMYPTANPTTSPTTGSPTTPPTAVPTSSPTMKPTEDPQLVAWQNFWDATAGSNWFSCYLRRNDPCGCNSRSTRKVECDENGRITSIILQSNRLSSSEFPAAEVASLLALDTVTSVDISSNSLLGMSPTCVDITECETKTCEFGDTIACQDTSEPTVSPTSSPSSNPSASPTLTPSTSPTLSPTASPSRSPSTSPTAAPTTISPTSSPTSQPTNSPSMYPTANPTTSPTTGSPTTPPTAVPTSSPTMKPTEDPQLVAWQNFWDTTAGSNWISCYLRRNDPCGCNSRSTRKVECDENGRITSIILQSNRLSSSEFPEAEVAALLALDTVTSVDISSNSVLGMSPTCVDIIECNTKGCEFGETVACQNTPNPTTAPSLSPVTKTPTRNPTMAPTHFPTTSPTSSPTISPTLAPSTGPTTNPSAAPTSPTTSPTRQPTGTPSLSPSASPVTAEPTMSPEFPTPQPTSPPVPTQLGAWHTFYDETGGSRWRYCRMQRETPCACHRRPKKQVICNNLGEITHIILSGNGMTADTYPEVAIRAVMENIPTLMLLDIRNNFQLPRGGDECIDLPECELPRQCLTSPRTFVCQSTNSPTVPGYVYPQPSVSPTQAPLALGSPTTSPTHPRPTTSPTPGFLEYEETPDEYYTESDGNSNPTSSPTIAPDPGLPGIGSSCSFWSGCATSICAEGRCASGAQFNGSDPSLPCTFFDECETEACNAGFCAILSSNSSEVEERKGLNKQQKVAIGVGTSFSGMFLIAAGVAYLIHRKRNRIVMQRRESAAARNMTNVLYDS